LKLPSTNKFGEILPPESFENYGDFGNAVCVLLDINLGNGSGAEVRLRLKADGHSVPVIYMTGNDTPAVREAALL
jgi:FixJ family two-component response regulator